MLTIESTYHRPQGRPRRALLVASVIAGLVCAGAAPVSTLARRGPVRSNASAAASQTLVIEGAGEGHGVGMSQDGALGYATHGWTYQAILAHYYTGTTLGAVPRGASVRVLVGSKVEKLPLEQYVRGVVSAEVPSSWPMAALEAQAVASRTYAITAHAGGSRFDVYADTRSQVYRGVAAETSRTNAAVAATSGQVVLYLGRPAITYFFASSGGQTENVEVAFPGSEPQPWLRGVADPFEQGSRRWKIGMSFASAGARLGGLVKGRLRGIEVTKRGVSPRIVSALVLGSAGMTPVSGAMLAGRLGLSDTWAYFSMKDARGVRPEPDRSGQARPVPVASPSGVVAATPPAEAATATPTASPQGGAEAPGRVEPTRAGGISAG
ncbi:MAG TPA: SpoIID/LytB domain-containing protein [Solirubrobacteraceae bacterium]|jgi:stage II sporulation protein D